MSSESTHIESIKDKNIIVLDNAIIEARYRMSLNEQKLFLTLVSLIDKNDKELKKYSVTARALRNILNISDEHIYEDIKNIASKLIEKTLFVEDETKKKWAKYTLFSVMRYENGTLYAGFNEEIKPFLLKLKKEFTKFQLREFKPFRSKYSIRMYQLVKQYTTIGERIFDIEDLRLKLGVKENSLKKFFDFRRKVLDISQRELSKTPMAFEWEAIKTGRKFTKIKIVLKNRGESAKVMNGDYVEGMEIKPPEVNRTDVTPTMKTQIDREDLKNLILLLPEKERTKNAEKMLLTLLDKYDEKYLTSQISYANGRTVRNYLVYLKKAVENDYANVERSGIEEKLKKERLMRKMDAEIKRVKEEAEHDMSVKLFREEKKVYEAYMGLLSDEQKNELHEKSKQEVLKKEPALKDKSLDFEIERLVTAKIIEGNSMIAEKIKKLKKNLEEETEKNVERIKKNFKKKLLEEK